MNVKNISSTNGNKIAKQFELIASDNNTIYFQSYKSIIVKHDMNLDQVYLDSKYWNYSKTTSKYINIFLGEKRKDTEKKIKQKIYILTDLNKELV